MAPYAVATPQIKVGVSAKTRVLKFPKKKGFGLLNIGESSSIEARGDITVPLDARITLSVGWAATHDLSPLRCLPADSLWQIDLRNLEITDEQLKNLEHLTLVRNINLSDTDVTDKGMESISKISGLLTLNVRGTFVTDKCLAALKRISGLRDLTISLTRTGDDGMIEIPSFKNLRSLNLTHTQVGDNGLKWIGASPSLTNLDLSFNKLVTDAGMGSLRNLKTLVEVNLANTSVTISGVKMLKNIKSLRRIVYSRNNIGVRDAHSIQKLMPKVQMLETLIRRREKLDLVEPQHMFAPLH